MSTRTILKNVGSNSLGYVVNVAVAFKLTPYVEDSLKGAGYGLWTLIVCFVGYYGLLDVGVRSAVGHYVATYHAQRDDERVNRTLSTAMALMLVVALVAGAVTYFAGVHLPEWYRYVNELKAAAGEKPLDLSAAVADPDALRTVVWIMGAAFALSFPLALYGTVLYSVQQLAVQNAIGVGQVLLRGGLTWWALSRGHGLLGLACVAVVSNVAGWIATVVCAYRVLPALSISFARVSRVAVRELFSYGGYNVLVNVGDTVLLYTSGIVIMAELHDSIAVTHYVVPATTLIPYFMQLVQAITWSFTPHFTGRWAVGQIDDVRRLLLSGTRGVTLLAALIGSGLLFLGDEFLSIWMKPDFVGRPSFPASCTVLAILAVATLIRASQSTGRQALFAMREVRWLGFLVLAEAIANVVLSVVLVRRLGIVGVAWATLIPVAITQGIVQPRHLLRELGLDWKRFAFDVLRAALPVVLVMGAVDRVVAASLPVHSLATFLLRGVVVATPAALVGLFCATTTVERARAWRKLARRA